MDLGLKDRVVIITGASRGIGRATARLFAQEGALLAVCSRDASELRAAMEKEGVRGDRLLALQVDVSRPNDLDAFVRATVERFGGVHVLVNNVGLHKPAPFEDLTDSDWDTTLELNLRSVVRGVKAVLPVMKAARAGRIINVASLSGLHPRLGQVASNVAKAGVVSLTKSLAAELGRHDITVNSVCPGVLANVRWDAAAAKTAAERDISIDEAKFEVAGYAIPLGRIGEPEECAGLITFLASQHASYVTGTTIEVDGGLGSCIDLRPRQR